MIRVLIVDDEVLLRRGLHALIHWEELECELVGEAANGLEALDFLEKNQVDLVITDIRMPVMNGLELIENINIKNKSTKVIIVSGYDDFVYAKAALQYGASYYVLKPVDEEEINEAILKAKEQIEDTLKLYTFEKERKQAFLKKFVQGKLSKEVDVLEQIRVWNLALMESHFCVAVGLLRKDNEHNINNEQAIINTIKVFLANNYSGEVFFLEPYKFCIILGYTDDYFEPENILNELLRKIEDENNVCCYFGVGGIYEGIKQIERSYQEAMEALSYVINYKNNVVICFERILHITKLKYTYPLEAEKKILTEVASGNATSIEEAINGFLEQLFREKILTINEIKAVLIELIIAIKRYFIGYKSEEGTDYKELIDRVNEEESIERMREHLRKELVGINKTIIKCKGNSSRSIIIMAKQFVEEHYAERFTLDEMVEQLFVSKSYFCKIFREETGTNFKNYLNDYRIERAKDLLKDSANKNYEVCLKVGLEDVSYFNQLFKKKVGLTPSEYRNI
ncbi:hypothetical protein CS063_12580 [Sporanaerobium hydrogeniformans]|uniref:Uncharacterized protein n=1 Tax=Sporanaerobium hydrogeniformans TaxID=3072179 RepID=A0AC61DBN5_9FIRM|nr:response regulator [Sporanaerobium hydrogeniformans]PHV69977.1 hypothetical protein CS063_12580 [Sporanaerobium hydrogeniformans]